MVRLLIDGQDRFVVEARDVLRAGLETSAWVTAPDTGDDTGARHKASNGVCTQIGNDRFAWFATTGSKSRRNFLDLLRADHGGQFNVGQHGLCWIHAERLVHKLDAFTEHSRSIQQRIRRLIWRYYDALKVYQSNPGAKRRAALRARFDRIFRRRTGFATLDRLLARLHANKAELLMVLDRPEIPLHTNGSENDIRAVVTKRKVSGGTRSDAGRDCRDAFLSLLKTCDRLGIAFWDYLGARLANAGAKAVPNLSQLVRQP